MKILVVDDSTINNILLQDFLESHKYEVHTSLDGREALTLIDTIKPDLILLDIMMPGISGFDVLNNMKQNDIKIPAIIISAYNNKEKKDLALSLGACDYIVKPINFDILLKLVNKFNKDL